MLKLKFPKSVLIGNVEFKIKLDKKSSGGSFEYWDDENKMTGGEITIGTFLLKVSPLSVLGVIIHELKEIIQVEQGTRFNVPYDNSYEFHYNHRQHTDLCSRLAGLLSQFIK